MTLTDEQREVVERIKASPKHRGPYRPRAALGTGDAAARWAFDTGSTFAQAAAKFGCASHTVYQAWMKLHPGRTPGRGRWGK